MGGTKCWVNLLALAAIAASPCLADWDIEIGGSDNERAHAIQQTRDGGYIVAASVAEPGGTSLDWGILKLDASGLISWQKAYGGGLDGWPYSIQQTADGGYVAAGITNGCWSPGCTVNSDAWVLKLDSEGAVAWQKSYGGDEVEWAYTVRQTSDGGYIVVGRTQSLVWVLKLDHDGAIAWQKTYGCCVANSIEQTADGGYILAAYTNELSGALRVIKLLANGAIDWQKAFPGMGGYHVTSAIQQTADRGYVAVATTQALDLWVLKLDVDGSTAWQKSYDSGSTDRSHSIRQTSDGGYLVAANTCLPATCYPLDPDLWLLKLDAVGEVVWEKIRQGQLNIYSSSPVGQTWDGGYIVAGQTLSPGVTTNTDMLILKIDSAGEISDPLCTVLDDSAVTVSDTFIGGVNTGVVATSTSVAPVDTLVDPQILSLPSSFNCYVDPIDLLGAIDDVSRGEGDSGSTTFSFTASLTPAPHTPITVDYATADATAEAGTDYTAVSDSLAFDPGESNLTIDVEVLGDVLREPDETFQVNLSGDNPIIFTDDQGIGTIRNDDFESDLALIKTDAVDPVVDGEPLTYTLTVTNSGPDAATAVNLTDDLPADLTFTSVTPGPPTCAESGGVVTCDLQSLAAGAFALVTIEGQVNPGAAGLISNSAGVTCAELDPVSENDSATEQTLVLERIFSDGFESGDASAWSESVP